MEIKQQMELESKIIDHYLDLNILYFALSPLDEDLQLAAILNHVERLLKSIEIIKDEVGNI